MAWSYFFSLLVWFFFLITANTSFYSVVSSSEKTASLAQPSSLKQLPRSEVNSLNPGLINQPRVVVADDSTGALNVALGMKTTYGKEAVVVFDEAGTLREAIQGDHAVVIDSKAGTSSESDALEHNRLILAALKELKEVPDVKIDYALRNVRQALGGFYEEADYDFLFFVAAMPRLGTKTEQGVHYLKKGDQWVQVHQTSKAQESRREIQTSDLKQFIHTELNIPENWILLIPVSVVSKGAEAILAFIREQNPPKGTVVIPDITENEHLDSVAQAVLSLEQPTAAQQKKILRVGASDFLRALMISESGTPRSGIPFAPLQKPGAPLALIGTANPITTDQIEIARKQFGKELLMAELDIDIVLGNHSGNLGKEISRLRSQILKALKENRPVVLFTSRTPREMSREQASHVSKALSEVIHQENILSRITALFVSGGETFGMLSETTSALGVKVQGEFSERIPWGTFYGGRVEGIPVISKQGGHALDPEVLDKFFKASGMTNRTFSHRDVEKQWEAVKETPDSIYDTLIIGGGAAGAGAIRDLATRGNVSALLVERGDFAEGTSSRSGKAIHPGVWYLRMAWHHLLLASKLRRDPESQLSFRENLYAFWDNLQLVWGGTRERKLLVETTQGTVEPLPHLALVYQESPDKKWQVFWGLRMYELFSWLRQGKYGRMKIYHNAQQVKEELPFIREEGLVGAVQYGDAKTNDKALVVQTIRDAFYRSTPGNPLYTLNHVELKHYQWKEPHDESEEGYFEATLVNRLSGEEIRVRARTLTNATGAWIDQVYRRTDEKIERTLVKPGGGSQIEATNRFINEQLSQEKNEGFRVALAPLQKKRRYFFRWYHDNGVWYVRIGSTDRKDKTPDNMRPTADEVKELVDAYNQTVSDPRWQITEADIYHADSGIRPLVNPEGENQALGNLSRAFKIQETQQGDGKIFHMVGVKLTEMRWAGYELGERLGKELRKKRIKEIGGSATAKIPFIRVAGEVPYRINNPGYDKNDSEYLRRRIEHLVNFEMLAHFSDYMFYFGGIRDVLHFDERGKPQLDDEKMRFLHRTLGNLLEWNEVQRNTEWQIFWENYEGNMTAVKAWGGEKEYSPSSLTTQL